MKVESRRLVDDVLVADEPCLGAVFCSYTFDPAYFEEQVLRALLRLSGDPQEDGARFHEEARAALRETPVACFVDASVRQGGRRLPYDLGLVRARTFHPKVILVLYESAARLAVGSGNVTRPGFEDNAELFFTRSLPYAEPAAAAMLRDVDRFLVACAGLATARSKQLELVREQLAVRIAATPPPGPDAAIDAQFVHSFETPGIRWLADVLPSGAVLQRVGVLAPFYERDDLDASDEQEGIDSVLSDLLALRPGARPEVDLGVPWDAPPLAPPAAVAPAALEAGPGLWAWRWTEETEDEEAARIGYYRVDRVTAKRVELRDGAGVALREERATVDSELADARLWPVPSPTVFAPARILDRLAARYPVQLWLHPAATLLPSGRPVTRPLHAKLFLTTVKERTAISTYALIGSANASRAALSRTVADGGNVEAGIVLRLDGEVRLHDVLPSLVACSLDGVRCQERPAPVTDLDMSAWIDDVVHDAEARTLTILWAAAGPEGFGPWLLQYRDDVVARGDGPGDAPLVISGFVLAADSAELVLHATGRTWSIPIRVADLAYLPTRPGLVELNIRALLAALGRRLGTERIATLRDQRGPAGLESALDAVFGDHFGPTDVFKAWWGLREDLSTATTLAAFRYRIAGLMGARAVWLQLCDVPREMISAEELWIYGCELIRELARVDVGAGPDRLARAALLAEVVASIRDDLRSVEPTPSAPPWFAAVRQHYGVAEDA
jgi:hypothetical protein